MKLATNGLKMDNIHVVRNLKHAPYRLIKPVRRDYVTRAQRLNTPLNLLAFLAFSELLRRFFNV